jgi:ferredoxin
MKERNVPGSPRELLVELDEGLCNGFGNCVVSAPDVFDLDPATNLAVVKISPVPADLADAALEAEADCPVRALRLSWR